MKKCEKVIIIGAGDHAKVIADIIIKSGDNLLGFIDDKSGKMLLGYPVLGKTEDIYKFERDAKFIIGIGNNYTRKQVAEKYNLTWHTAIHPSAVIAIDVSIGEGTVVMANAVINVSAKIGRQCIINSGAVVEHDNNIADYAHISPNAAVAGTVSIGELTQVGVGAAVRQNISICAECVIGAGAVVVKDITEKGTYVGVPARKM